MASCCEPRLHPSKFIRNHLSGMLLAKLKHLAFSIVNARQLNKAKRQGLQIGQGVVIYGSPLLRRHPDSKISLGDRVVLCSDSRFTALALNHPVKLATTCPGASIHIGADSGISGACIVSAAHISIGSEVLLGANVAIFDTDFHPLNPIGRRHSEVRADIKTAPVRIGDNVFVGTGAIILRGTDIGRDSVVAAGSIVRGSFPAGAIIAGNPAKVVGSVYTNDQLLPGLTTDGKNENSGI